MKFISLQIRLVAIFGLCIVLTIGGIVAYGVISSEHSAKFVEQSAEAAMTAAVEVASKSPRSAAPAIQSMS